MANGEKMAEVFLQCRARLCALVSRIVPPDDIEDIVGETYVRLCRFTSNDEIREPRALMVKIARNLAFDHVKRAESRLRAPFDDTTEAELAARQPATDDPARHVVSSEEFGRFCQAVRRLPTQCRRVFVLKKVYGYTQREIARELGLSESTVEKHIAKGLKQCVRHMQQGAEVDQDAGKTTSHESMVHDTGGDRRQ